MGRSRDRPVGGRQLGAGARSTRSRSSSPSHNVTYVTRRGRRRRRGSTFAAAAGYTGDDVAWGCAVWGTGWYYPPYVGYCGGYPYYYPLLPDLRLPRLVQPVDRRLRPRRGAYGPYGGAGVGARYNPRTGTYARGAAAYGPYGARGAAQAYNPRTGAYGADAAGLERLRQLGTDRACSAATSGRGRHRVHQQRAPAPPRARRTGSGGGDGGHANRTGAARRRVGRTGGGDVYAGRDGNVYRKDAAAAGRSTTTAPGETWTGPRGAERPRSAAPPASSSTTTTAPAPRARSARAITGATRAARAVEAGAPIGEEVVASGAAAAGAGRGGAPSSLSLHPEAQRQCLAPSRARHWRRCSPQWKTHTHRAPRAPPDVEGDSGNRTRGPAIRASLWGASRTQRYGAQGIAPAAPRRGGVREAGRSITFNEGRRPAAGRARHPACGRRPSVVASAGDGPSLPRTRSPLGRCGRLRASMTPDPVTLVAALRNTREAAVRDLIAWLG